MDAEIFEDFTEDGDSTTDLSLSTFKFRDRRFIVKGDFLVEAGDSFGVDDWDFFAATGVVLMIGLAGDFLGVVEFLGEGDFSLIGISDGASSWEIDVSNTLLPRFALVGVLSETVDFFGAGSLIAKLAGVVSFVLGPSSSSSKITTGLVALRFDVDLGVFLFGVGVFLALGVLRADPFAGVATFLADVF